jgi:hypothetical protein
VRLKGPASVAFAWIAFLQVMTWACSARTPAAVPAPAQTTQPPETPATATTTPDPQPPQVVDPPPRAAADECALIALPGEPITTVGLTERIDPANALHPSNASERLLFGQIYETLVRVDCMGRVRPGLASSWRVDDRGVRVWYVALREDARFSDGAPVTAADVRAGWTRDGAAGELETHVKRHVSAVHVLDDRTLGIQLSTPRIDAPLVLAHPDLAVAKRVADSPLPLGTRSSRLDVAPDRTRGVGLSELTISRDNLPPLRFVVAPGDPRDLLDAGVDLLLTRDPATLDYAAALPHLQRVPLAWQRTHVFVTPWRSSPSPSLSDDARQALANDAVRGEARGAQGPFWFETTRCHPWPLAGRDPGARPTPRIVYDASDGTARDLAERIVALAKAPDPSSMTLLDAILPDPPQRRIERATGLTGEALATARYLGIDAGYLFSVDSRPLEPCNDLYAWVGAFPSLTPGTIVPLVDTRLQAVVRHGTSGATVEFDNGLLLVGVNDPGSR